jgi:hypothetical protein
MERNKMGRALCFYYIYRIFCYPPIRVCVNLRIRSARAGNRKFEEPPRAGRM